MTEKGRTPRHGWGKFGSYEWHENVIKTINNSYGLIAYVKAVTGRKISNLNNIPIMKKLAIGVIRKHLEKRNDSKSR